MPKPFDLPVDSRFGAPMGRENLISDVMLRPDTKFYLEQVPLHEGYDKGGVYWGIKHLYCLYTKNHKIVRYFNLPYNFREKRALLLDFFKEYSITVIYSTENNEIRLSEGRVEHWKEGRCVREM